MSVTIGGNAPTMSLTEWNNAPFNREDNSPIKYTVTMSTSLSKDTVINLTDYVVDETGDVSVWDTDWENAVSEDNVLSPLEIIKIFQKRLEDEIAMDEEEAFETGTIGLDDKIKRNKYLLEQCKGWTEDDWEVIPE